MKNRNVALALLIGIVLSVFSFEQAYSACEKSDTQTPVSKDELLGGRRQQTKDKRAVEKIVKMEMPFIVNNGQQDERVAFYAHIFCGTVFVTKDGEMVYVLPEHQKKQALNAHKAVNKATPADFSETIGEGFGKEGIGGEKSGLFILREKLAGSTVCGIRGEEEAATKIHYFKGDDTGKWMSAISSYRMVSLGEVYEGIDLKLKAYGNAVEKLFYVKPGANPDKIRVCLETAERSELKINDYGGLAVETQTGMATFSRPVAYQIINGKKVDVPVAYYLHEGEKISDNRGRCAGENKKYGWRRTANSKAAKPAFANNTTETAIGDKFIYGFRTGDFDRSKELIIDPMISSAFLGGSSDEECRSLAVDSNDNVFVLGVTLSDDFPVTDDAYATSSSGNKDVFISKFSNDLTSLLASTYLGGSNTEDAHALAIDSGNNVYITGFTYSKDFPVTGDAYDVSYSGGDAFVSKLSGDLGSLSASTYLGGSYSEEARSLAIDKDGNIYVAGMTSSTNFPTTEGAYDTSSSGLYRDVFITKFDDGLTRLLASTYLGGSEYDGAYSLALDAGNNVYVTGITKSEDFPVTDDVFDESFNGGADVFLSKFNSDLTSLLASTYLGGYDYDGAYSLALDSSGNVYVTGYTGSTESADFPTTAGAYDSSYYGGDVFVSKFNDDLTSLLASTYLGGSDYEEAYALVTDAEDNVYVTGITESEDFPVTDDVFDESFNGGADVFLSKFNSDLTSLLASTYLGGTDDDKSLAMVLGTGGGVYIAGSTYSNDFPVTEGAYGAGFNSESGNAFISRFDSSLSVSGEVTTGEVLYITVESATLHGTINAAGLSTIAWFEYGTVSGSYDNTTEELTVGGYDDISISSNVSSLSFNTTYYYRLAAKNSVGTLYGSEMSFKTSVPCERETVTADQRIMEIARTSSAPVTITVACKGGDPRYGALLIWEIIKGGNNISISPENAITDDDGQAVFAIEGIKKGNATVRFVSSDSNSKVKVKVRVTQ